jgi:hypothetical protein
MLQEAPMSKSTLDSHVGVSPVLIGFLLLLGATVAISNDKTPKTYPEHGNVVAVHTAEHTRTSDAWTDPMGKTHGADSYNVKRPIYRIETEKMFYELEGRKGQLQLGEAANFRVEKDNAYVQRGDREDKLRVVGVELKPNK